MKKYLAEAQGAYLSLCRSGTREKNDDYLFIH